MDVNLNLKRTNKNRKRKRHSKIKRREQARLEVRFSKRRKLVPERNIGSNSNTQSFKSKDKLTNNNNMQANTFWENYEAAHEWQRRHSVEWWKSRCVALEQENAILRDKIRELAGKRNDNSSKNRERRSKVLGNRNVVDFHFHQGNENPDNNDTNNDNLEFQIDEDMMNFFEQSIRHKLELKEKRDAEFAVEKAELEKEKQNFSIEGGAAWIQAKTESAKLLYGKASPRILAMETALQATIDRHKDRAKPQYWPNIPLNL